jgi:tetraacyldisaccharide 4'-kinase
LIGEDATSAVAALPAQLPVLRARLMPGPEIARLAGRRVLAFAGIGRPAKFFDMLASVGLDVAERISFPDHHPYRASDIARLIERARMLDRALVTTPKDAVRLPALTPKAIAVIPVHLVWERPELVDALLADVAGRRRAVAGDGTPG